MGALRITVGFCGLRFRVLEFNDIGTVMEHYSQLLMNQISV